MLNELVRYDKELFLYLNNLGTPGWDPFWLFLSGTWSAVPLYLVLLYIALKQMGARKTLVLLVAVALLITTTDQLANFFKYGLQRLRPCYDPEINTLMRLVKNTCGGQYGFFSAHAANSFAAAFFCTYLLKSKWNFLGIFLMIWAMLVSFSRVYIGVHFPLDIAAGASIGLILSWLFAKLYIFAIHKYHV
jgi:undecaprenyl-diphosphatase